MISVQEAMQLIELNVVELQPQLMPLAAASGKMLASAIYAKYNIPAFPQSAMDGYAFQFSSQEDVFEIVGEVAAGDGRKATITSGKAVRIFTGAPLPEGTDTVIMQEKTSVKNGCLHLHDEKLQRHSNVRPVGSEIMSGDLALPSKTLLSPAAIGFLAGIGICEVFVVPHPDITLIVTGNELQDPGQPLAYGQVYESNSASVKAALQDLGVNEVEIVKVKDDPEALMLALQTALKQSNMVLLTGGVSVGDYDFVLQAAEKTGVKKVFHKVKQRPGKPLFFGMYGLLPVFGLPGNPSSVLTCFYEYVLPALSKLTGRMLSLKETHAVLSDDCKKAPGLTHFQKGYFRDGLVTVLPAQESYKLSSFAVANCLLVLDENKDFYSKGDDVLVHLFPGV